MTLENQQNKIYKQYIEYEGWWIRCPHCYLYLPLPAYRIHMKEIHNETVNY